MSVLFPFTARSRTLWSSVVPIVTQTQRPAYTSFRNLASSSSCSQEQKPVASPSKPQTITKVDRSPLPNLEETSNTLPILPRPLGQQERPTTAQKTWQQTTEEMMNKEKRLEKRKALVKEATQGYFHDFHQIRRDGGHGGKTWIGPPVLIREDRSLYFPNISGATLAARTPTHTTDLLQGKVSVVVILSARISEEHAQSFVGDVLEDWEGDQDFQYVQINHQPNPLKSFLLQLFISSLKRTMKEERWPGYMIAGGEWGGLKGPLAITNKHVGYIYLVDPRGKIRWAGCGFATPEEQEALRKGVAVLLGRAKHPEVKK